MMECGDAFGGFFSDVTLDFVFHVCIVFDCTLVFFCSNVLKYINI